MTTPPSFVLTYHGVEAGPPPLFVDPGLFSAHLAVLHAAGAHVVTVAELVAASRRGGLEPGTVALAFDDGFASVATHAAPFLQQHGWPATVYCVAGHLGGANDWPTQPAGVPRRPLLTAAEVAGLAAAGFEIGAHTVSHPPLGELAPAALEEEVVGGRTRLEAVAQAPVTTFACPYGDPPSPPARALIEATYDGCCGARLDVVRAGADPYLLPRVDAHYFRRPWLLARLLRGDVSYLGLRRSGARARRAIASDRWAPAAGTGS